MFIYVIKDMLSDSISKIMLFKNDDVCLRFLKNAIEIPNSPFGINLSDSKLFQVAEIDESTLKVVQYDFGREVIEYNDLVKSYLDLQKKIEKEKFKNENKIEK